MGFGGPRQKREGKPREEWGRERRGRGFYLSLVPNFPAASPLVFAIRLRDTESQRNCQLCKLRENEQKHWTELQLHRTYFVPAKHSPATEGTQDCVHPLAEGGGHGREICDQMITTLSGSKPKDTKIENILVLLIPHKNVIDRNLGYNHIRGQ